MSFKVNEELYINETKLKCIESHSKNECNQCYFHQNKIDCLKYEGVARCHSLLRTDKKSVHYINIK